MIVRRMFLGLTTVVLLAGAGCHVPAAPGDVAQGGVDFLLSLIRQGFVAVLL